MAQNQGGATKQKRSRRTKSAKQLAGTLEVVLTGTIEPPVQTTALTVAVGDVREEWEVQFSRFVPYPSPPIASACSDLVIVHPHNRNRRSRDRWISAASSALVRLARDYSSSDVVLTVCFTEKILEEHYVSKLRFVWPQVSCMSGFPARGTRAVFVAYKDSFGKVQKFGLRFLSLHEAEEFMGALKEICNEGGDPEPLNTDARSEVSAQSELTLFSRPANQACKNMTTMCAEEEYLTITSAEKEDCTSAEKEDWTTMTPADTYTPQISPSLLNNESDQYSHTQESVPMANGQSNFAALPPSFTSFLSNCGPVVEQVATQPTALQEADLKAQIARYMEDESFQDMLIQVEKVINEIGGDLTV